MVDLELRDKARMAEQLQAFRQALPEAAVVLVQLDLLAQQIWVETAVLDYNLASLVAPLITQAGEVAHRMWAKALVGLAAAAMLPQPLE